MLKKATVVFILANATILLAGVGFVNDTIPTNMQENSTVKNYTSSQGVEYRAEFIKSNTTIRMHIYNPNNREVNTDYVIKIDGERVVRSETDIGRKESKVLAWNLSSYQNPTLDNHTVVSATFDGGASFTYTRNISTLNTDHVPTPYISDVDLVTTTYRGKEKAALEVTVVNPSIHPHSLVLMAHTTESTGHQAGAGTTDRRTATIPLDESPSEIVVGEVRLTGGDPSERDGAFDQVHVNGTLETGLTVSNESFVPVTPPWERNSYEYENESVVGDGRPDPLPLPFGLDWRTVWLVAGPLVVLLALGRRLRG